MDIPLSAKETVLLLLQPNFVNFPDLLINNTFEARGYAEVFLNPHSSSQQAQIIITPEHRGTFAKISDNNVATKLGEISYALPVQNGGVFNLNLT